MNTVVLFLQGSQFIQGSLFFFVDHRLTAHAQEAARLGLRHLA